MQRPKVYVPRITTSWSYMSERNVAALSEFSDPLVEGTRLDPFAEGELIERIRGARAILQCNGSGCDEITPHVLREVATVAAAVLAHSWGAWPDRLTVLRHAGARVIAYEKYTTADRASGTRSS